MKSISLLPAFPSARTFLFRCVRCGIVAAVVGILGIATVARAAEAAIVSGTVMYRGNPDQMLNTIINGKTITFGVNGRF